MSKYYILSILIALTTACFGQQTKFNLPVIFDRCTDSVVSPMIEISYIKNDQYLTIESTSQNLEEELFNGEIVGFYTATERGDWYCPVSWSINDGFNWITDTFYLDKIILSYGSELHSKRSDFTFCGVRVQSDTLEEFENGGCKQLVKTDDYLNLIVYKQNSLISYTSFDRKLNVIKEILFNDYYNQFIVKEYRYRRFGRSSILFKDLNGEIIDKIYFK